MGGRFALEVRSLCLRDAPGRAYGSATLPAVRGSLARPIDTSMSPSARPTRVEPPTYAVTWLHENRAAADPFRLGCIRPGTHFLDSGVRDAVSERWLGRAFTR